jgi:hypothetical protein
VKNGGVRVVMIAYVIAAGEEEVIARETAPVVQSLTNDCRGRGA